MPIYEYECDAQGHHFEKLQSMQDEPIQTCLVCGGPVHKIFHPAGIIFKGSGWYINDSRKPAAASSEKTETPKTESPSKPETAEKNSGG